MSKKLTKKNSIVKKTAEIKSKNNSSIGKSLAPLITSEVYDSYWKFAAKRQEAFFARVEGHPYPWTADPVISKYKFTNVFRASDRVSQYLIRNVIYREGLPQSPKEILFRILLFKLFNKIETWELLRSEFDVLAFEDYNFNLYDKVLNKALVAGRTIYSAAYIMPSGKSHFGYERKHTNHLRLIEAILESETHNLLVDTKRMQDAFEILKSFPGLGDFLAYQLLIDINYSTILNFSESEFVVPGPGAKGGISKCFIDKGGLTEVEIIKFMVDNQDEEFQRLGLQFKNLWGRKLQLIDCQNIFCEVDKYARVVHPQVKGSSERTRIKQIFKPNFEQLNYWFPPKWGINNAIDADSRINGYSHDTNINNL